MRRLIAATIGFGALLGGVALAQSSGPRPVSELTYVQAEPGDSYYSLARDLGLSCTHTELWAANGRAVLDPGTIVLIPPSCADEVTATTSTTIPETTSTTTPLSSTTTTEPAQPAGYVNAFSTAADLDELDVWVYHRNVDLHEFNSFSGGSWQGDHDETCGPPSSKRTLSWDRTSNQEIRRANSVYWCPNAGGHFMSSMGDVDGYSVVAMSPNVVFDQVRSVCVDVSLTDLGTRQWLKLGVVTDALYQSRPVDPDVPGHIVSDAPAADVPQSLATDDRLLASWSGGVSAGYPGGMKIGDTITGSISNPTPNDNMTRHPVCLADNGDGSVTFTVAGVSATAAGSFPAGPVRVMLYQHAYTPSKSESGSWGTTFHWDNLIVE